MTDLTNPIFTDADKAREHLEALRWPEGPVCPHCGSTHEHIAKVESTGKRLKPVPEGRKHRPARKGLYVCNACKEQFTVQVGTVLEKSHIPLNKWLAGFFLMCSSKKGVSAHQLHRTLAVSYKSAWFMAHRIREAMRAGGLAPPMGSGGGVVEIDETYQGVKSDTDKPRGGFGHKRAILTLVNRQGEARSFHVETANTANVLPIVKQNLSDEAVAVTDESRIYDQLGAHTARHLTVNHARGEYVSQDRDAWIQGDIHTNTVEGYFSVFKRGMKGVYQHCSEKHLHRYLAEFDFRYSNRSALGCGDTERTARAIVGAEGKRLTYRRTHGA